MQLFYALLRQSASMSRAGTRRTDAVSDDPGVDGLTSREAEVLKTLKAEADRVAEKLHSLYMARESVITLTATATGGVIALTGSTARYAAILLLPYVLLGSPPTQPTVPMRCGHSEGTGGPSRTESTNSWASHA